MGICILEIAYGIFGFIFQCTRKSGHAKAANCFMILGYFFGLAWIIWGTFLRWAESGTHCSGDDIGLTMYQIDIDMDIPFSYSPYLLLTG